MSPTSPAGASTLTSRVAFLSPQAATVASKTATRKSRTAILSAIVSTYELISDLRLTIEGHELERLEHEVSSEFTRVTTIVRLRGGGEEGLGEDVTYSTEDHDRLHAIGAELPLAGE